MKKTLGVVIILAVLVLGGYYAMGMVTERTIKHNIDVINRSNGLYVKLNEYRRGWFTSRAALEWRVHVPERVVKDDSGQSQTMPAQDYEIQMPLDIYHGPVIIANNTVKFGLGYAHTDIPVPAKYNEQFNANFVAGSVPPVLNLNLFVSYLNRSNIELHIPAFKLIAKQGGQFDWMGMNSSVNVTSGADNISGDFTIDGMQFVKDDVKTSVGEISSDYDLHKTSDGLYLGDANLVFPSLVINNKEKKIFELAALEIHSISEIKSGLFNSELKSSVDKIQVNDKKYGPGKLNMAIRNLDAESLGRINQQINKAQQGTDLEKQQAMLAVLPEFPKLVSKGAEFEISELSFAMPEGNVEGNLVIRLPAGENTNPLEMLQKVTGQGKIKIPADVVKMALDVSNRQKIESLQQAAQSGETTQTAVQSGTDGTAANTGATTTVTTGTTANVTTTGSAEDTQQQINTMTQSQLNAMLQSGLLVQEGNYYIIEATLEQGKLEINSKSFDPAMLKF